MKGALDMGRAIFIMASVLLVVTSLLGLALIPLEMRELKEKPIREIDLADIPDGSYKGKYRYGIVTCAVEVTVTNHKIVDIEVLRGGRSSYARSAEAVLDCVLEEQSLQVDVVSGATTTSRAFLKAVENALSNNQAGSLPENTHNTSGSPGTPLIMTGEKDNL